MTNQPDELFELCNQVYEKTGWDGKQFYKVKGLHMPIYLTQLPSETKEVTEVEYPLYTSDYLLEKLSELIPVELDIKRDADYPQWFASDSHNGFRFSVADTPLLALLKLTLGLHKEGLLND